MCGNGTLESNEQCDDGDRVSGDGCSSTCLVDRALVENVANQEPNDFPEEANTTAATPFTISGNIRQLTDNLGDFSEYDALWLDSDRAQILRIETFDRTDSDDCAGGRQFVLEVHDDDALQAIGPDSFQRAAAFNSIGNCAALTLPVGTGEYIAVLYEASGLDPIPFYRMQVSTLADRGPEQEPNDALALAQLEVADGLDVYMTGAIAGANDVDVYAVHVPGGRGVRAEVIPTSGTTSCDGFNTRISLIGDDGVEVAGRASALEACAFIDGNGASPRDVAAKNITTTPRTMYIAVAKGSSGLASSLPYHLAVTIR